MSIIIYGWNFFNNVTKGWMVIMQYLDELCQESADMSFLRRLHNESTSVVIVDDANAFLFVRLDLNVLCVDARKGWEDLVMKHLYFLDALIIITTNDYIISDFDVFRRVESTMLVNASLDYHMPVYDVRKFATMRAFVRLGSMTDLEYMLSRADFEDIFSVFCSKCDVLDAIKTNRLYMMSAAGKTVGYAMFSIDNILRYVYIFPEYRRKSYATYFLMYLSERNSGRQSPILVPENICDVFKIGGYKLTESNLMLLIRNY